MFDAVSCASTADTSNPSTPSHGTDNLAPKFAEDEHSYGVSLGSSVPKHVPELSLGPPVLKVPIPPKSSKLEGGSVSHGVSLSTFEMGNPYLQHPRRAESQIQLSSTLEDSEDEMECFKKKGEKRRSQSSPVLQRRYYDANAYRETHVIGAYERKIVDAFDLLESELNDVDNEFAGDIELGRKGLPSACVFVANLAMHRQDKQLQESVFKFFSTFARRVHVKIRRDGKNMPYAFVQYETEAEACNAIKHARGSLLDSRRIRCEQARVSRTIVVTKRETLGFPDSDARELIDESFGPYELMKFIEDKNTGKKYCFVKFIYRGDAIDCYGILRHDPVWNADWENDHARVQSTAVLPTPAVEVDHTSIFIGNLNPEFIRKEDLISRFSKYGKILDCNLINNKRNDHSDRGSTRNAFAFIKYGSEESAVMAIHAEMGQQYLGKFLHVQKREMHDKYFRNGTPMAGGRRMSNETVPNAGYQSNQAYQQQRCNNSMINSPSRNHQPYYYQQQQRYQSNMPASPSYNQQPLGSNSPLAEDNEKAAMAQIVSTVMKISLEVFGKDNKDADEVVKRVLADMQRESKQSTPSSRNSGSGRHFNNSIGSPQNGPGSPVATRNFQNGPGSPVSTRHFQNGQGSPVMNRNVGNFGSPFHSPITTRPRRVSYSSNYGGYNSNTTSPTEHRSANDAPQYNMPNRSNGYRRNFNPQAVQPNCTGGGVYLPGFRGHSRQVSTYSQAPFSPVLCSPGFTTQSHSRRNSVYLKQNYGNPSNHNSQEVEEDDPPRGRHTRRPSEESEYND